MAFSRSSPKADEPAEMLVRIVCEFCDVLPAAAERGFQSDLASELQARTGGAVAASGPVTLDWESGDDGWSPTNSIATVSLPVVVDCKRLALSNIVTSSPADLAMTAMATMANLLHSKKVNATRKVKTAVTGAVQALLQGKEFNDPVRSRSVLRSCTVQGSAPLIDGRARPDRQGLSTMQG